MQISQYPGIVIRNRTKLILERQERGVMDFEEYDAWNGGGFEINPRFILYGGR